MRFYRYDIHIHTKETSRCGHVPAAEMVSLYSQLGYTGLAITDHLHEEYIQSLPNPEDWENCITHFLAGFHAAKEQGDALGMDIVLGLEIRFAANTNDFLIYGVDEAFLLQNPFLHRTDIERFWEKYHNRLLIIQAHPYRGGGVNLHPQCLHGVEIINGNPRHDSQNHLAVALAKTYPLLRTCASDAHQPGDEGRAAMCLNRRVTDSYELKEALEQGGYQMECPLFATLLEEAGATEPVRRAGAFAQSE